MIAPFPQLRAAVVAKMVSQAWKALSDDERTKWVEMGRLDRERYEREKKSYKGPWKVPDVKNPNAPKKPMSSFLAFSNERRRALARANPNMNGTELSCLLAKLWKESPPEVKQMYKERELREREVFKKCRAEWERRQDLAAKVAQWTQEMPNGQDLCTLFMDDDEEEGETASISSSSQGSTECGVSAAYMDESSLVVSVTGSPILSAALAPINPSTCPASTDNNNMFDDMTPLPFDFAAWSQANQPLTPEAALGVLPILNQVPSATALTFAEPPLHVAAASSSSSLSAPCYDHYSIDDILQDDTLFEDFSPRDVPKVPTTTSVNHAAAPWNPTPTTSSCLPW